MFFGKILRSTTTFIVAAALVTGCDRQSTNSPPKAHAESVTLASSKNLWATLPIIALRKGYFADEGLNVRVEYVQTAKFAMDALVAKQADFATVVELNVAFLGFTGNSDPKLVATITETGDSAIVARRSAGVASPADLAGKRIGVLPGTTSAVFADRFLAKHGIASSDIEIQNLQPVAIQTALVEKGIDAGSVWQPFTFNIVKALGPNEAVVFKDPSAYRGYMNVAVNRSWHQRHETATANFLKALARAEAYVLQNPDQAQAIMAREIGLDLATVKAVWGDYKFQVGLDPATLQREITREGEWIIDTQDAFRGKSVPNYATYLDGRPLRAAIAR